jgi:hypothetical protein
MGQDGHREDHMYYGISTGISAQFEIDANLIEILYF